VPELFSF